MFGRGRVLMLVAGLLAAAILISPAGAHVTTGFAHLWSKHIKPKVTDLVYTKKQSNARFLRKNAKARNSDKLDGLNSTAFARSTSEPWHVVGAPGEPPFGPLLPLDTACTWSHYEHPLPTEWPRVSFYKDPIGVVHLRGLAKMTQPDGNCNDEEADHTIFVLPTGYRPDGSVLFSTISDGQHSRLDVKADGRVISSENYAGNPVWVSLDGLTFRAGGD